MTNEQKIERFHKIVNEMANLYAKKNNNYGDSFHQLFEKFGPVAGLVPMHNKLDRATFLMTKKTSKDTNYFESLEDTLRDLACYAIMNLLELEEQSPAETGEVEVSPETTGGLL